VRPLEIFYVGVHCTFSEKNKGQVLTLKMEDNVKIKGYCTGSAIDPVTLVQCKKVD
jgi:hypothetical protein